MRIEAGSQSIDETFKRFIEDRYGDNPLRERQPGDRVTSEESGSDASSSPSPSQPALRPTLRYKRKIDGR